MEYKDPILVTGCARSGTSLVSAIFNEAGASGGIMSVGSSQYNPTGFYENQEMIQRIDKDILGKAGFDMLGQSGLPDENLPAVDIRQRVFDIIASQGLPPNKTWFFKDAKLLLVQNSYVKSFPGSKIVLVRREKQDIVSSCMHTAFMYKRSTVAEWGLWVDHHVKLMDALKLKHSKVMEVQYENLKHGNYDQIKLVIEWLGLEYHEDFINSIIIKK